MTGWVKITDAAKYADVSKRTVEDWLKQGLKYSRLPSGTRLIKFEWIDEYLESFMVSENEIDIVVDEIMSGLKN
ncbi:MAG TPA: hypothetical protein DEO33_03750 [Rikenellaceae bacterium]|jgi:excisionase family DNA binding protein|nr:hypothetical protein [Rikenellaceae bacterium]